MTSIVQHNLTKEHKKHMTAMLLSTNVHTDDRKLMARVRHQGWYWESDRESLNEIRLRYIRMMDDKKTLEKFEKLFGSLSFISYVSYVKG